MSLLSSSPRRVQQRQPSAASRSTRGQSKAAHRKAMGVHDPPRNVDDGRVARKWESDRHIGVHLWDALGIHRGSPSLAAIATIIASFLSIRIVEA